jgi:hypothetical protein
MIDSRSTWRGSSPGVAAEDPNRPNAAVEELRARLERSRLRHQIWSMVAAEPALPPEAAAWASNVARSWAAVGKLARKALTYEDPQGAEAMKDFPDSGKPFEVFPADRRSKT